VVRQLFEEMMERAGVTLELMAQRIYEGLNATETRYWQPKGPRLVQVVNGAVTETPELISRTLISFSQRREMLVLCLRMRGLLADKHEVDAGPTLAELLEESYGTD
jgi:hypothetical protein